MSRRSFEGPLAERSSRSRERVWSPALAAGAVLASLFAACSDTSYYALCEGDCTGGGAAGDNEPASSSGTAGTRGGASSGGGGGAGALSSGGGAGEGGAPGGSGGVAGDAAGGSAGGTEVEGEGGGAGAGGAPAAACNPSLSPIDEPCLVSDAFAVFAKANPGSSAGDGSLGNPFSSLAQAIRAAEEQSMPIVVACISSFKETIELSRPSGATLRIVGGFLCSSGTAQYTGMPTTLEATAGTSLLLSDANDVELSDFEIRARDAQSPGASSVAAIVARSERITLTRVHFVAGKGRDGASGEPSPQGLAEAPSGNPAQGTSGGTLQSTCTCSDSIGGRGGDINATSTRDGGDGLPALGGGNGGKGGASCETGDRGNSPGPGSDGTGGKLGELDETTWQPGAGSAGGDGAVGQGGGGGGGGPSGGGGSGGCGGCGGKGGAPGQGGGASIALLSIDSTLSLSECAFETSSAGNGGEGQPGQPGQPGGAGGMAATTGCRGGLGAEGGDGGGGGGGAGGISVGILHRGAAPELTDPEWSIGAAGLPGAGGNGADTAGSPGMSQQALEI